MSKDKKPKKCSWCAVIFTQYKNNSCSTCSEKCRFMTFVDKLEDGCWVCNKKTSKYPSFMLNGKSRRMKVASYAFFVDENNSSNKIIRNNCKNTLCINPDHLIKFNEKEFYIRDKCSKCSVTLSHFNAKKNKKFMTASMCLPCNAGPKIASYKECRTCKKANTNARILRGYCSDVCKFYSFTKKEDNGCITWIGKSRESDSHIRFYVLSKGSMVCPFKFIFSHHNKEKENDEFFWSKKNIADTICQNKLCVNVEHIYFRAPKTGIVQSCQKVTTDIAVQIKTRRQEENLSYGDLAKIFKISKPVIAKTINNRTIAAKNALLQYEKEIEEHDICKNCSIKHDSIGSEYCSTKCMNEYLNS